MDTNLIDLVSDFEILGTNNEEFASISLNPSFNWAKVVITDNLPNGNKKRIPESEFDNIINTGIYAPLKMGKTIADHEEANGNPIGAIAAIKKLGNQLIGLVALWPKEHPDEVNTLLEMSKSGVKPQVSWEIAYDNASLQEDGFIDLTGCSLNALCVVKKPAYKGRTAILEMASQQEPTEGDEPEDGNPVKDNTTVEENNLMDEDKVLLEQAKTELASVHTELDTAIAQVTEMTTELNALREFKAGVEAEKANAQKLEEIKAKFETAGIKKDETYFSEKKDELLKMDETVLDFLIQEIVAGFGKTETSSLKTNVPALTNNTKPSVKSLAQKLREQRKN
jgi:hypothetical protein